jgi:hypothetical protein
MIPQNKRTTIGQKLTNEIGIRKDVEDFLFKFSALPVGHDLEYALNELGSDKDERYKKAVRIVLAEI